MECEANAKNFRVLTNALVLIKTKNPAHVIAQGSETFEYLLFLWDQFLFKFCESNTIVVPSDRVANVLLAITEKVSAFPDHSRVPSWAEPERDHEV